MLNRTRLWIFIFLAVLPGFSPVDSQPMGMHSRKPRGVEELPLFQQACRANRERYEFALEKGAQFQLTPDGKSFLVIWAPPQTQRLRDVPLIVTLHGHGSYAFDEFFLWYKSAERRKIGIVALQWWFGKGEKIDDYYSPWEIYPIFERLFREEGIAPGNALLHGFSRGSANVYGVTALDRHRGNRYFLVTLANAGKAGTDFPINRDIQQGKFGPQPFQDSHWILYAGGCDPNPKRDGIPGMRETAEWIKNLGGTIDLFLEDRQSDHGGFHRNPKNVDAALDRFQLLLQKKRF